MSIADRIYCINLDKRKDRWNKSMKEFDKIGISHRVRRFPAIEHKIGIAGCTLSHLEIVKECKRDKIKKVLIFEDDIEILHPKNFYLYLGLADSQLKEDYDMFYLGGTLYGKNEIVNKNLIRLRHAKATHAYIIAERIYDKIIKDLENIDYDDPKNWSHGNKNRYNIDEYYVREFQKEGKVYAVSPMLATQLPGYSDVWDKDRGIKDSGRNKKWMDSKLGYTK